MAASVRILAGDLGEGVPALLLGTFGEYTLSVPRPFQQAEAIDVREELAEVALVRSEEAEGELPLQWQVMLRARRTQRMRRQKGTVTFVAQLKDGRKFLALTDTKTFKVLQGAADR
jgi:hypothetical protein